MTNSKDVVVTGVSDGGVMTTGSDLTGDLTQVEWSSTINQHLNTLQFEGCGWYTMDWGQCALSPMVQDLIAGAMQDNGIIYSTPALPPVGDGTYWVQQWSGDGSLVLVLPPNDTWVKLVPIYGPPDSPPVIISENRFVPGIRLIYGAGNTGLASQWKNGFQPGGGIPVSEQVPSFNRVEVVFTPKWQADYTGGYMLAVATGQSSTATDLFGLFYDNSTGAFSWTKLASLPEAMSSASSFDGSSVLLGANSGNSYIYNTSSQNLVPVAMPVWSDADFAHGFITFITFDSLGETYAIYNGRYDINQTDYNFGVVLKLGSAGWQPISLGQLPAARIFGLAAHPSDGRLFAATEWGVYSMTAQGWMSASTGLPAQPRSADLRILRSSASVALYLGT
jgi:hypothetical protein